MFKIFEKLGGEDKAIRALKGVRLRATWPTEHTIKAWRKKREIPGAAVTRLMAICEKRGIEYSAADFTAKKASASRARSVSK
jgi:hypothetical protein